MCTPEACMIHAYHSCTWVTPQVGSNLGIQRFHYFLQHNGKTHKEKSICQICLHILEALFSDMAKSIKKPYDIL